MDLEHYSQDKLNLATRKMHKESSVGDDEQRREEQAGEEQRGEEQRRE